jgi:hypothetical protein
MAATNDEESRLITAHIQARRAERRKTLIREAKAASKDYATGRDTKNAEGASIASEQVARGVSSSWLSQTLDIPVSVVKTRLAKCPVATRRGDINIYELKVAVEYLIRPRVDMDEFMRTLRPEDLPVQYQEQFWSAMNKRQKYQEDSGELWRSADVAAKIGELCLLFRNTTKLWADELAENVVTTPEQVNFIERQIDQLHSRVRAELKNLPRRTRSELQRMEQFLKEKLSVEPMVTEVEDDEFTDII